MFFNLLITQNPSDAIALASKTILAHCRYLCSSDDHYRKEMSLGSKAYFHTCKCFQDNLSIFLNNKIEVLMKPTFGEL